MNPNQYNATVLEVPQQDQLYKGGNVMGQTVQLRPPVQKNNMAQQGSGNSKPRLPEKMPKARALAMALTLKKWLVVASIVSFGTLSGLAAFHQVGAAANSASQTSSGSSQSTSSTGTSSQNNNSFFSQGGNNIGSSTSSQGSSSASSTSSQGSSGSSSSSSTAVSGTSVS
jgi:hypothetical protein